MADINYDYLSNAYKAATDLWGRQNGGAPELFDPYATYAIGDAGGKVQSGGPGNLYFDYLPPGLQLGQGFQRYYADGRVEDKLAQRGNSFIDKIGNTLPVVVPAAMAVLGANAGMIAGGGEGFLPGASSAAGSSGAAALPAGGMTATGATAPWAGTNALGSLGSGTFGTSAADIGGLMGTTGGISGTGLPGVGGLSGLASGASSLLGKMNLSDWINGIGTIGGIIGANKSANALVDASDAATAELRRQYDQNRADMMPWLDAGKNALAKLTNGFDITQDPSYQFRLSEGQKALERSAAAKGNLFSGATGKALEKYGQDLASTEYGNQWNRYASQAGFGQTAASNLGSTGTTTANNIAQNTIGAGNARGSGFVGMSNALMGGIGNFYNNQTQNRLLDILQSRNPTYA